MGRTCFKCDWVHFAVTRAHAEAEVVRFNEYYEKLTPEKRQDFYGGHKSSIDQYEHCMRCGNVRTNFRDEREGDCPAGCTINPIIHE